jgi:hypothetical protein
MSQDELVQQILPWQNLTKPVGKQLPFRKGCEPLGDTRALRNSRFATRAIPDPTDF